MINFKKIICILFLYFLIPFFIQISILSNSQLIFRHKAPNYTKKELISISKKLGIKIPKLAMKIYTSKIDIRDMCFEADVSISMTIRNIQPFGTIDKLLKPTENALLFAFSENSSSGMFFIDDDYIWYVGEDESIQFKLVE